MNPTGLDELLQHPSLWRASSAQGEQKVLPTGFRRLDERLPGGGWPLDTLIELLLPLHGIGEINLLLPALRTLCAQDAQSPRWIAWLGPPHLPYAPALASAHPRNIRHETYSGMTNSSVPGSACQPTRWIISKRCGSASR